MSDELLSPDDISQQERFEARRKILNDHVREAYSRTTPKEKVEKKGKFDYADYAWMLKEFHELHPRYKMKVVSSVWDGVWLCYDVTVELEDIETKELRTGVGCGIINMTNDAFASIRPETAMRLLAGLRQHRGNAFKSGLTLAIRDAFSHFGIASDVYRDQVSEPITKEQQKKFNATLTEFSQLVQTLSPEDPRKAKMDDWIADWITNFKTQNKNTANDFIDQFTDRFTIIKERLNVK